MTDPIDYDRLARSIDAVQSAREDRNAAKHETMSTSKVEEIVRRVFDEKIDKAITKAVADTLISFNLDPAQRTEIQRDMLFIRDMRELSAGSKKHILFAIFTALTGGLCTAVWLYVKATGKA